MLNIRSALGAVLATLLGTGHCWAIDLTFNWAIPPQGVAFHNICWGQSYRELQAMSQCRNVGYDTVVVNGIRQVTATVYNVPDETSLFFAANACSLIECSPLCKPVYRDANPSTTFAVIGDYDGDGVDDRIYKTASGDLLIDWSRDGLNSNNAFDQVLSGYGDAGFVPIGDPVDDDRDGVRDLAFQDAAGNIYIDHSSNGFSSWDATLVASKRHSPGLWISGHGLSSTAQFSADVNGDGRGDAVVFFKETGDWYVSVSTGTEFQPYQRWITGHGIGSSRQMLADVTGDGRADAVVFSPDGTWYVAAATGNGFGFFRRWITGHGQSSAEQFLADVNADGRADAVVYFSATGAWYVALSSGGGFEPYQRWISGHGIGSNRRMLADVDGDGRSDAVVFTADGSWYVALATKSGNFSPFQKWLSGHGAYSTSQFTADVDGDGRSDAVVFFAETGTWYVSLSTGKFFQSFTLWISNHGIGSSRQMLADVSGDGRSDAVVFFEDGMWSVVPEVNQPYPFD